MLFITVRMNVHSLVIISMKRCGRCQTVQAGVVEKSMLCKTDRTQMMSVENILTAMSQNEETESIPQQIASVS